MYSVAQTVVPQGQDGFWTWFTDSGIEVPEARTGCLPSAMSASVVSVMALPLYCLTTDRCQWCWRRVGGFCRCYQTGLRFLLAGGWEPLHHVFHLILGFLTPGPTPSPVCAEKEWWRSVRGLLGVDVAVRSLCFSVPALFFVEPHAQSPPNPEMASPWASSKVAPFPRPCTALRSGDEALVKALKAVVVGGAGGADSCPGECGRLCAGKLEQRDGEILGNFPMGKYQGKPVNEWHADLSYHRDMVENPLVPAWVFPNVPVRKFRWDFLWFRRVCLWWVASYHGYGGAGMHNRVGLDPVRGVRDWILEEMDGMQTHEGEYMYHVPFPSPPRSGYE